MKQIQKALEEEKAVASKAKSALDKQKEEYEREKASQGEHFWRVTEELKVAKTELANAVQQQVLTIQQLQEYQTTHSTNEDRILMTGEDVAAAGMRLNDKANFFFIEKHTLKSEIDSLRSFLLVKEDAYSALSSKLKSLEDARINEKADVKNKMNELKETVASLRNHNHELEKDAMEARHKLGLIGGDITRYTTELEHLQAELTKSETARIQKEAEYNREIKAAQAKEAQLLQQRDEALHKLSTVTTQFDIVQQQLRDTQSKNWDELQRAKDMEAQMSEETELLTQELQEKTLKLIAVETERAKFEEYMRNEVSNAANMANALRGELERRLEELTVTRKERDQLRQDTETLHNKANEMEEILRRNEINYKKTLESDRSKIQQEIRSKMTRLKGLEGEKAELLKETNELMSQLTDSQKELSKVRSEVEEAKKNVLEITKELDISKMKNQDLVNDLKISTRKEQDLRDYSAKMEMQFREDINRLDQLVKESKKAAAQQVLEITLRAKAASEEVDELKAQRAELVASEKKAFAEVEKVKIESEMNKKNYEEMQQQMGKEMTAIRREIAEYRTKGKLQSEAKTAMEMELMTVRLDYTKQENELHRMSEWIKDSDVKIAAANEQTQLAKQEAAQAIEEQKKLKSQIIELNETVAKKTVQLEKVSKDIGKVEREGLAETRRLKVTLAAAEQELSELRPVIPMLQKELSEGKANFAKLQQSTNSTVNGLLEELKNTENALSHERKKNVTDAEKNHARMMELQNQIDRLRENVENTESKSKADRNDNVLKLMQAEAELERTRSILLSKDSRLEELEKQHQIDRSKLHELKEQLDNAERAVIDNKTNLELEQAQRRRVENRLRTVTAEYQKTIQEDSSPVKMEHPKSATSRSSLLYDDYDYSERDVVYDDAVQDTEIMSPIDIVKRANNTKKNNAATKNPPSKVSVDDDDVLLMSPSHPSQPVIATSASQPSLHQRSDSVIDRSSVDRVSAALAARASAETSKNALKQAQLQRNMERQQNQVTNISINNDDVGSGELKQYQVVRRSSKGKVNEVRELVGAAAAATPEDVEDTIQRTQLFLQQRLAQKSNDYAAVASQAQSVINASASVYDRQMKNVPIDASDYDTYTIDETDENSSGGSNSNVAFKITTPSLNPAKPEISLPKIKK